MRLRHPPLPAPLFLLLLSSPAVAHAAADPDFPGEGWETVASQPALSGGDNLASAPARRSRHLLIAHKTHNNYRRTTSGESWHGMLEIPLAARGVETTGPYPWA